MTERRNQPDQDAARSARDLFERATQALPAATAARLRRQRVAALQGPATARARRLSWGLPAGAMAALLIGVAWWRGAPSPAATPPGSGDMARAADVVAPPAAAPDDAELYAWLADAPVASDAGTDGAL